MALRVRIPCYPLGEIMSKETLYYRQCCLQRGKTNEVHWTTVSWIPEKFAKVGWTLQLKDRHGVWVDGWDVVKVGPLTEAKQVENQAHNSDDIWKATSGPCPRGNK